MTQKEKDDLCDGKNFQNALEQFHTTDQRNQSPSLKRHRTNGSDLQYDHDHELENVDYNQQTRNIKFKRRNNYSRTDQSSTTNSRTYTNSNSNATENRNAQQRRQSSIDIIELNVQQHENHLNALNISNQALNYAASTHLQPITLQYFYQQNISYHKPTGFEQWWIDKEGNIQGITNEIDLYVYLCNPQRYPKEIDNTKITPLPPKHLPPQRSVILKWIKNSISINEIKEELEVKYKSIYSIQDIIGSLNTRNRHIRIDFQDENEYKRILNSGKVTIFGQLFDSDEYLPAPKLLICSKCNTPGHSKKTCVDSQVERCRRCGNDRNDKADHKLCEIKCHHCGGAHTSTDYSCPIIHNYRRELILELKNRPDLLPAEAQLFIPTECREHGKLTKILENKSAQHHQLKRNQQHHSFNHYNVADQTQWPPLPSPLSHPFSTTLNNNINETIKSFSTELKTLKENYAIEQRKLEDKYKNHLNLMNQNLLIMQQQIQTQTEMFNSMDDVINSIVFSTCTGLIESLTQVVNKLKNDINQTEIEPILHLLQQQLLFINDKKSTYNLHQIKLNQLVEKQREVFVLALNTIIKQPNEL